VRPHHHHHRRRRSQLRGRSEEEDTDEEEFFIDLPMDAEAEEAVAEQRAILTSFETWRRNETAQQFMAAERRAAAARLADAHSTARADAHHATSRRRGLRWWRLSNASPR
jgi:hypothetical protein